MWRQKEQFSDGAGCSWIDSFIAFATARVNDVEMETAHLKFPVNTPTPKEAYYDRDIFHSFYPQDSAAAPVKRWIPKWH